MVADRSVVEEIAETAIALNQTFLRALALNSERQLCRYGRQKLYIVLAVNIVLFVVLHHDDP